MAYASNDPIVQHTSLEATLHPSPGRIHHIATASCIRNALSARIRQRVRPHPSPTTSSSDAQAKPCPQHLQQSSECIAACRARDRRRHRRLSPGCLVYGDTKVREPRPGAAERGTQATDPLWWHRPQDLSEEPAAGVGHRRVAGVGDRRVAGIVSQIPMLTPPTASATIACSSRGISD